MVRALSPLRLARRQEQLAPQALPRHGRVTDGIKNKQLDMRSFPQLSGVPEESDKRTVKPSRKLHWFESSTRHHLRKHRLTSTNAKIV